MNYFPLAEYWWIYTGFLLGVLVILGIDLGLFNRSPKEISTKAAASWVGVWVTLALLINYGFYLFAQSEFISRGLPNAESEATRLGFEFLTGYVIELALSVDNLFVFIVLFSYFGIESKYQHRILFFGVLGALIFRGLFIGLGSLVVHLEWVMILLGVFLIFTGAKLVFSGEKEIVPEKNFVIKMLMKTGRVLPELHGQKFFVRKNAKWFMTPAFICLIFVEMTDIVFAMDSVPAIFAITKEPMVVFLSNVCAILGLRSMYFLLASAIQYFQYLQYGLAAILIFIGLKMGVFIPFLDFHIPTVVSLSLILSMLSVSMLASVIIARRNAKRAKGHK